MRVDIKFFFFFLLSFYSVSVFSQKDSISEPKYNGITSYFYESQFLNPDLYTKIETPVGGFQNYHPRNNIGNVGLPINSLIYKPSFGSIGFNYAQNNYEQYFFNKHNLKFYSTRSPYTDILYVMGSKKEQVFNGVFSYNVKPNWNVSAYFTRIRSEGFYLRQNTNQSYVALSSNYISNKNRYALLVSAFYNAAKNTENGGIKYDTAFFEGGLIDKKILQINLTQAKREMTGRAVHVNQFVNFGKRENDTSSKIIPSWQLQLNSNYEDNDWRYNDGNPNSGFYSNIYMDSIVTNDKIVNSKIENSISINRVNNQNHSGFIDWLGISFCATHQLLNIRQNTFDSTFNNVIIGGKLYSLYNTKGFSFNLNSKYVVSGFNKSDYNFSGLIKKEFSTVFSVSLNGSIDNRTPDFIYSYYNSNNFKWNNLLQKTTRENIGLNLESNKYNFYASLDYSIYNNVPYFDNYAIAKQYIGSINVINAQLKKNFKAYNWHLDNYLQYNYVPDSTVIRLPQFVLNHSLYYENDLFKKAMRMQIGFSIFYTSFYYANAYMPATSQFYIQDNKKYGNYPFVDFFINAKIKMVNVFLKIDHLNSGLSGNTYMQTPNFPTNDRAFKIGLSWRFFD